MTRGAVDYGPNHEREAVAIGDTFHRVGDPGGAWEVTQERDGLWSLERGRALVFATTRQILDRAIWVPAPAI
jgi:hypothetical protein